MRALANRIRRLEERLAPADGDQVSRIAAILYERRRALALARGEPFNDPPPEARPRGPMLTIAETLWRRRQELQQQRQSLSV